MQPTTSASDIAPTPTAPTQAAANTNPAPRVINAANSQAQLLSNKIRLSITTSDELAFSPALPAVACPPTWLVDARRNRLVQQDCELSQGGHLHSINEIEEVPAAQNPIPAGAEQVLSCLVYEDRYNLPAPHQQTPVAARRIVDTYYPLSVPLNPAWSQGYQFEADGGAIHHSLRREHGFNIHRQFKPLFLFPNTSPIRQGAFAWHQAIRYASAAPASMPPPPQVIPPSAQEDAEEGSSSQTASSKVKPTTSVPAPVAVSVIKTPQDTKEQVKQEALRFFQQLKQDGLISPNADPSFFLTRYQTEAPKTASQKASRGMRQDRTENIILLQKQQAKTSNGSLNAKANQATKPKIPNGWELLDLNLRRQYVNLIKNQYIRGASRAELCEVHGITNLNIEALLWLTLDQEMEDRARENRIGLLRTARLNDTLPQGILPLREHLDAAARLYSTPHLRALRHTHVLAQEQAQLAVERAQNLCDPNNPYILTRQTQPRLVLQAPRRPAPSQDDSDEDAPPRQRPRFSPPADQG